MGQLAHMPALAADIGRVLHHTSQQQAGNSLLVDAVALTLAVSATEADKLIDDVALDVSLEEGERVLVDV